MPTDQIEGSAERTPRLFSDMDESSSVLISWWTGLNEDRGGRAVLRRASTPSEVAFCGSFHRLLAKLREAGCPISNRQADWIAAVAGLVAHVKSHAGGASVAQQMATPKSPGAGGRVSGLRFRRVLAAADRDELYPLLIRVVRLLDGNVNVVNLAKSAFWWNERTKKEWAYDYYATAPSEL